MARTLKEVLRPRRRRLPRPAFTASSGRLKGLAYRMLGSRADAEDVVQDAYLRLRKADGRDIRNVEAFLMTTVTRLCLDVLKSARVQREVYVGPWLPEPVLDAESLSPGAATEIADDLSFALLLVMEKLSAPERAAFLLHDVFDAPYAPRSRTALGKSEAACRQLAARARKAVRLRQAGAAGLARRRTGSWLLARFAEAVSTGDATPPGSAADRPTRSPTPTAAASRSPRCDPSSAPTGSPASSPGSSASIGRAAARAGSKPPGSTAAPACSVTSTARSTRQSASTSTTAGSPPSTWFATHTS